MKRKLIIHIIIAIMYHIILFGLEMCLIRHYVDSLISCEVIFGIAYFLYWIISCRKSYMPWLVYVGFVIGTCMEFLLNGTDLISDYGIFGALGQWIYVWLLGIQAALLAIINLLMWVIWKIRLRNSVRQENNV